MPDDGWRYEVVEGVLVRVAGSRPKAVRVTMRLLRALDIHVEEHRMGSSNIACRLLALVDDFDAPIAAHHWVDTQLFPAHKQ